MDELGTDSEWRFMPATTTPSDAISATAAVAAASAEIHGDSLSGRYPIKVALARVTDAVTATGHAAFPPLNNTLLWVIEADGAQLEEGGGPVAATLRPYKAVEQWLIDATSGKYVVARDFAQFG